LARYRAEYHAEHGFIDPPRIGKHPVMRSQGQSAGNGEGRVKFPEPNVLFRDKISDGSNKAETPRVRAGSFMECLRLACGS
jgi:hypothetical protein